MMLVECDFPNLPVILNLNPHSTHTSNMKCKYVVRSIDDDMTLLSDGMCDEWGPVYMTDNSMTRSEISHMRSTRAARFELDDGLIDLYEWLHSSDDEYDTACDSESEWLAGCSHFENEFDMNEGTSEFTLNFRWWGGGNRSNHSYVSPEPWEHNQYYYCDPPSSYV